MKKTHMWTERPYERPYMRTRESGIHVWSAVCNSYPYREYRISKIVEDVDCKTCLALHEKRRRTDPEHWDRDRLYETIRLVCDALVDLGNA